MRCRVRASSPKRPGVQELNRKFKAKYGFEINYLGQTGYAAAQIVIERLTVWEAASAHNSLVVIFVGVAITLPVIIIYTIFMYRVFWGRAALLSYAIPAKAQQDQVSR